MHQLQAGAVKHVMLMTYLAVVVCGCSWTSHWDLHGLRVCSMLGPVVHNRVFDVNISTLLPGRRLHVRSL